MPYTHDVFGLSTNIREYSYVDRNNLDKKILRLLKRDTHIALKGASKSGKSWLRQKCIPDAIVVQCRLGMTIEDIYRTALSSIGVSFDTSTTKSTTTSGELDGQLELKVPVVVKTEVGGTFAFEGEKSTTADDYHRSISNLEFVAAAVKATNKRLIIEDFHYLSIPERRRMAHDLKTLWDYKCFVVLIGVWTQTNLLTSLNPDLTGRIEEISILWTPEDLHSVISKGTVFLNVAIDESIKDSLVNDSFGNVGILQILLLKYIEDEADIEETLPTLLYLTDPDCYQRAAKAYADQLDGRYQQFAKLLSTGIRKRKKATGIYAYAMEAIVSASDEALINGFPRSVIFDITNAKQPRIKKGNLKTVLGKLIELQEPEKGHDLVISYDESIDAVFVVDRQLLFYRKYHTMLWPWEDMVEEAEANTLFEIDDD